jgi:hypothetical protein
MDVPIANPELILTWHDLHLKGIELGTLWTEAEIAAAKAWLGERATPASSANSKCNGCDAELAAWIGANRLKIGLDFFIWGWALHNRVNVKLRKAAVMLGPARATWRKIHLKNLSIGLMTH